jgi:hypothetical protein
MKLIPFACVVWLTVGCASPLPANRPGAYQFPDAAGMHAPVLVLTATNTFAFVDEDGGPWANHGTVTTKGRTLVLRYEATECCQFADVTWEELVILEQRPDGVRVRFRGAEHWLQRLPR